MCEPCPASVSVPGPRPGTWLSFFFSSRRRHTRCSRDWSSDVCSSDLPSCHWLQPVAGPPATACRGRPPFRSWRRPRNPFFYQFAERTDTLAAFSRISGSCDRQPRSKGLLGGSAVVCRKWRVVGPGSHEADLDDRLRAGDEERGGWHDRFSSFHSSRSSPRYSDHSLHPARDFFFCNRKSTRLNSSHGYISYAVFCLTKKLIYS